MTKKDINIVWFKRDLRFVDHEPLFMAHQEEIPILLVYFFEPSVMNYDDSDVRHWRFIYESIQEMQTKLNSASVQLYFFHNEVQSVFEELVKRYEIAFDRGIFNIIHDEDSQSFLRISFLINKSSCFNNHLSSRLQGIKEMTPYIICTFPNFNSPFPKNLFLCPYSPVTVCIIPVQKYRILTFRKACTA